MKELNVFRKFLNENKMQTAFPEFVGEPNDKINDLANQFVIKYIYRLIKSRNRNDCDVD